MKKLFLILTVAGGVLLSQNAKCQKLGYVNSTEILMAMPEEKTMEETLKKKSDEYQAQLEKMYGDYYKKMDDFQQKQAALSEPIKETLMKELSNSEKTIQEFEEKAKEDIGNLQQKLLAPIQEKANNAVKAVAKETGYTWVFDIAAGSIVQAPESDDLTPVVKKKLGIVDAPKPASTSTTPPSGTK